MKTREIDNLSSEERYVEGLRQERADRMRTVRQLVQEYMDRHPEEKDLSINPERGTFSERHKGLIDFILKSAATGILFETENFGSDNATYKMINEEQNRRLERASEDGARKR